MNSKQQLALALVVAICILWGLIAAESLWWGLLLLWMSTWFYMRKYTSPKTIRMQTVDLGLIGIGMAEVILYFWSTYPANSVRFPLVCLTFILLWFYLRQWIGESSGKQILVFLTVIGGLLGLFTLFFFIFYWVRVSDMGFGDITQFRFLYRPMGMFSNDWASIMLAFIPFATASWLMLPKPYNRLCGLACGFINLSIIVSFSRGAIFSLVFFYILVISLLFYYRKYNLKLLTLGCCIWFAALALVCIPIKAPLLTTLAVTENTSQVRSIEGRINKWKDAGQLFLQHPITGVGAGNFTLRSEPRSNQRDATYTGRCTNSWLQLAAEKGVVGLSAYGLFLIFWLVCIIRRLRLRQKPDLPAMVCGAGIMICLLREATFSTLFDKPVLLLLVILLFWLSSDAEGLVRIKVKMYWVLAVVIPVICFGVLHTKQKSAVRANMSFLRAYEKGKDDGDKLQKSLRLYPANALLHANEGIYLLSKIPGYDSLLFPDAHIPEAVATRVETAFGKAVALNPDDASFQCNLGVVQLMAGNTVNGLQHLKQSLKLAPHQSIYHVLCGMAYPDDRIFSHQRFVHAVYYSPDILDSKWFSDLQAKDSTLAFSIVRDAQAMLSDSLTRRNTPLLKARLAKVWLHQGKTALAENLLDDVTREMPSLNRPWLMMGDIAAMNHDSIAVQYYERAMLLDPTDAWAKIRTGDWYMSNDDLSRAFGYYMDALRVAYLTPTEHSLRSYSMYHSHTAINDVVPPAFCQYIRPYVNVRKLADLIAQGFEYEGNTNKAAQYRQFANGEIDIREIIHL